MIKRDLNILFISLAAVATLLLLLGSANKSWNDGFNNGFGNMCPTDTITDMYTDYIEGWKVEVKNAFSKAESEVFKTTPKPDIIGPDPDPKKCICGGSGWIIQGDGHKTPCPYHAKADKTMESILKEKNLIFTPLLILE